MYGDDGIEPDVLEAGERIPRCPPKLAMLEIEGGNIARKKSDDCKKRGQQAQRRLEGKTYLEARLKVESADEAGKLPLPFPTPRHEIMGMRLVGLSVPSVEKDLLDDDPKCTLGIWIAWYGGGVGALLRP